MDNKMEQISFSEIMKVLLKRKKLIAIITVAFLLVAIVESFVLSQPKFESTITLEINNIETEPLRTANTVDSLMYNKLENIAQAGDMNFDIYLEELVSEEVLQSTVEDLGEDSADGVESLEKNISISSDEESKIIEMKLMSDNFEEGNKVLDIIVKNFKERITELSQENSQQNLEIIKTQMEIEKGKYEEALEEYRENAETVKSPEELELEIEGVYEKVTEYKLGLNDLNIEKESIIAGLDEVKSSSTNQGTIAVPSGGGYIYLNSSDEALSLELASIESEIKSTRETIKKLQDDMAELKIEYQEAELEENPIVQKLDLTKDSYKAFSKKYEELAMEDSIDIGEITINVKSKSEIPRQVGRSTSSKLIIATLLGVITGMIVSLLLEYINSLKGKLNNS